MDEVNAIFYVARCGKPHSWLIGLFTKSKQHTTQYSHAEIQLPDTSCIGSDEADGGVRMRIGLDTNNGCWAKIKVPVPNLSGGLEFYIETKNDKYDWGHIGSCVTKPFRKLFKYGKAKWIKDSPNEWVCDEWQYEFLRRCGCDLPKLTDVGNPNENYDIIKAYVLKLRQVNP